jgi:hypothetical protein
VRQRTAEHAVVLVRPPVHAELYAIENHLQGDAVRRTEAFLAARRVPYIDLNPSHLSSADRSHVDWFDTPLARRLLADRVVEAFGSKLSLCQRAVSDASNAR